MLNHRKGFGLRREEEEEEEGGGGGGGGGGGDDGNVSGVKQEILFHI